MLTYLEPNFRKLDELPHHLLNAGRRDELWGLLCDPIAVNYYANMESSVASAASASRMSYYCQQAGGGVKELSKRYKPVVEALVANRKKAPVNRLLEMIAAVQAITQLTYALKQTVPEMDYYSSIYTELCEMAFGEGHVSATTGLKQKAETLWQKGDHHGALALLNEALAKQTKSFGRVDTHVVSTLQYRARMYKHMGQLDKVVADMTEAVAICKQLEDTLEATVMQASCVNNLAEVLIMLGNYKAAHGLLVDAQATLTARRGEEHEDVATVYNNLGSV